MDNNVKSYYPVKGRYEPCPPITKYYSTPPHIYIGIQKEGLEQYSPKDALKKGTLWPIFYEYYLNPYKNGGGN
ncbi:MAG: spore coat associated protein CotJA [Lactovum sp.]